MKQLTLIIALGAALALPTYSAQAFGLGDLTGGSKNSNAAPVDIDAYIANAKQASGLIAQSSDLLWKATASKAEIDKGEAELKAANEIKDPKEKDARLKQIQADHETQLAAALNDKEKQGQLTQAKGDKQKSINGALYNFVLGSLKDAQVLEQSSALIKNLTGNVANLSKLGQVKDVAGEVKSQIDTVGKISGAITKLASSAKLELPKSAGEAPKSVEI